MAHCWEHRCTTGVCWVITKLGEWVENYVWVKIIIPWVFWLVVLVTESRWGKSKSRWRKRKAVEEFGDSVSRMQLVACLYTDFDMEIQHSQLKINLPSDTSSTKADGAVSSTKAVGGGISVVCLTRTSRYRSKRRSWLVPLLPTVPTPLSSHFCSFLHTFHTDSFMDFFFFGKVLCM